MFRRTASSDGCMQANESLPTRKFAGFVIMNYEHWPNVDVQELNFKPEQILNTFN